MKRRLGYIISAAALVGLVVWFAWPAPKTSAPTTNTNTSVTTNTTANLNVNTNLGPTVNFTTADIPERDSSFDFNITVPSTWRVEYRNQVPAMNFYIPKSGLTALQQAQLYVTTASASAFTVPTTLVGTAHSGTTSDERQYRRYILARSTQAGNNDQPSWWSEQRTVVIIAADATKRSTYTTLNFAPTVSAASIDAMVASLQLGP